MVSVIGMTGFYKLLVITCPPCSMAVALALEVRKAKKLKSKDCCIRRKDRLLPR